MFSCTMIAFTELTPGMEYEIHVRNHYYRGTFRYYSLTQAFFDPVVVVFKEDVSWECKVKSLDITQEKIMNRYKTDDAFFYVGACSLTCERDADCCACNAERFLHADKIDAIPLFDSWRQLEISRTFENVWHFLYIWYNGEIDPSTVVWNKDMDYYYYEGRELPTSYNRLVRCVKKYYTKRITPYEQGKYFHNKNIYKRVESDLL